MAFSWESFLRSRRIEYTLSGARQVSVHCPFCGVDDLSHHMSINLDGRGWRCWRAPASHFGRAPARLVQALTGCTSEEARRIVGGDGPRPAPVVDVVAANLARLRGAPVAKRPHQLEMPRSFHPLHGDDPRAEPFARYLTDARGYRSQEVDWLARTYDLRWAVVGLFSWRLIFPVRDRRGELLTWTARTISQHVQPRYKQPTIDESRVEAPKTLLGLDKLWAVPGLQVLVVCEGPLDATRIAVSGAGMGVWATCLFGLNLSSEQRGIIVDLVETRSLRLAVLLDAAADSNRLRIARQLLPLRPVFPRLPAGVGDPGELTSAQAARLCLDLLALK